MPSGRSWWRSSVALCAGTEARLRVLLATAVVMGLGSSLVMGVGSALSHAPEAGDPSRWYFGSDCTSWA